MRAGGKKGREVKQDASELLGGEMVSRCWVEVCKWRKRISGLITLHRFAPTADSLGLQSRTHPMRSLKPAVTARKAVFFDSF